MTRIGPFVLVMAAFSLAGCWSGRCCDDRVGWAPMGHGTGGDVGAGGAPPLVPAGTGETSASAKPVEGTTYRATGFPAAYHQQDGGSGCGAACIQMQLESESLLAGHGTQGTVLAEGVRLSTREDWAPGIAPDGLLAEFDACHPSGTNAPPSNSAVWTHADANRLAHRVAWSLLTYQKPVAVLVAGWAHWLVVSGFIGGGPTQGDADSPFPVAGFLVCDPYPPIGSMIILSEPAPDHTEGDGCATGTTFGRPESFVPLDTWVTWTWPVPYGAWQGSIYAIGDAGSDPPWLTDVQPCPVPGLLTTATAPTPAVLSDTAARKSPRAPVAAGAPLPISTALATGLRRVGLHLLEGWNATLKSPLLDVPSIEVTPLFASDDGDPYAIVPLVDPDRDVAVLGRVGAEGRIFDAQRAHGLAVRYLKNMAATQTGDLVVVDATGRPTTVVAQFGGGWILDAGARWTACDQAPSGYLAFRVLRRGEGFRFVRLDGAVFAELTQDARGQ